MKAERRHELQNNELAEWLANLIEKVGPQKNLILGLVVLGVVAIALGSYLAGKGARDRAIGWANYFTIADSANSDGFSDVAEAFAGTPAGDWAANAAAFGHLSEGAQTAFTNRDDSKDSYEKAKTAFSEILSSTQNEELKIRAHLGLAQAHEALGEFDEAIGIYKSIVEEDPESVIGGIAAKKQAALEKSEVKDWYTWFASQEPKQSPLSDPTLFNNMDNVPADPNLNIPEPGNLIKPDGATTPPAPFKLDPPDNADNSTEATTDLLDFPEETETETDGSASADDSSAEVVDEQVEVPADDEGDASDDSAEPTEDNNE